MRALWLADVIRDAGLTIRPFDGWETRGGDDFDPLGVILHHTVTRDSMAAEDWLLAKRGNSTTPPPLANYSTNRDGTVSIIAAGTANHGGKGSWNDVYGNRFWFGDEMKNLGSGNPDSDYYEPWPQIQLESAYRAAAAVLTHLGATVDWLVTHERYADNPPGWPGRKNDPHSHDLELVQAIVQAIIEGEDMLTAQDVWWFKIADPTNGELRGAAHLLRQSYKFAYQAAVDAAIARQVAETLASRPVDQLDPAEIEAIAAEVAERVNAEAIAEAVADEQAERLAS
jgi:hypothetical protein